MPRVLFLVLLIGLAYAGFPAPAAALLTTSTDSSDPRHLPWADGESLTYLVSLGAFQAAEGTFVARAQGGDRWEFKLALASRGLVSEFYPFTGTFWSIADVAPWRSIEYGEYRFEPRRVIKERTRIDYALHRGTWEIWSQGKVKTFPVPENAIDDVGTMLYHLRLGSWKPGDYRLIHVYESGSDKEATAECDARETRAFGIWPRQPLVRLLLLPGKGTHHKGRLTIWMTDDARHLPIHSEIEFRYGSFSMDLTKADKVAIPTH